MPSTKEDYSKLKCTKTISYSREVESSTLATKVCQTQEATRFSHLPSQNRGLLSHTRRRALNPWRNKIKPRATLILFPWITPSVRGKISRANKILQSTLGPIPISSHSTLESHQLKKPPPRPSQIKLSYKKTNNSSKSVTHLLKHRSTKMLTPFSITLSHKTSLLLKWRIFITWKDLFPWPKKNTRMLSITLIRYSCLSKKLPI